MQYVEYRLSRIGIILRSSLWKLLRGAIVLHILPTAVFDFESVLELLAYVSFGGGACLAVSFLLRLLPVEPPPKSLFGKGEG
jgi:hypothetical protein